MSKNREPRRYGVDICYGTCRIEKCLEVLRFWEEGMNASALYRKIQTECASPERTASTVEHFVRELFGHRFLTAEGLAWARVLKRHARTMPKDALIEILCLLTARWDPMFSDFLLMRYWPRVQRGEKAFPESTASDFLSAAAREKRPGAVWSERRFKRICIGLNGLCSGYGLWQKKRAAKIFVATPPVIHPEVALLLACELHERGLSDEEVLSHRDWGFFGLDREGVIRTLSSSRFINVILVQTSADLACISWKKTMLEAAARHD